MSVTLTQILNLVGKLDDAPGEDTARERFRRFLMENIREVGQVRDYLEECLRTPGEQYNRALQDLVNHLGGFLGFEVDFGRYQGLPGAVGFDGHWKSETGFHLVVEVKTSEVYAVKAATLVGYVDGLISEKRVPSWEQAMGLYVIGRPDPALRQIENAIIAEKRTSQLRIISVESLLSLSEIMNQYDVSHDDILAIMRPSGPGIDSVVDLMSRLVAQPKHGLLAQVIEPAEEARASQEPAYWITPVKSYKEQTAEECIRALVQEERIYAFGDRTPGRKDIRAGDWICFYATAKGVSGHGTVTSEPKEMRHPRVSNPDKYPWVFRLDRTETYLDTPIVIDAALRGNLDAFKDRDPDKLWGWFVQATRRITKHDFVLLTGGKAKV